MAKLFNMCNVHGSVSDNFSMSLIVSVLDGIHGKKDCYDNCRHISLVAYSPSV